MVHRGSGNIHIGVGLLHGGRRGGPVGRRRREQLQDRQRKLAAHRQLVRREALAVGRVGLAARLDEELDEVRGGVAERLRRLVQRRVEVAVALRDERRVQLGDGVDEEFGQAELVGVVGAPAVPGDKVEEVGAVCGGDVELRAVLVEQRADDDVPGLSGHE